MYIYIVCKLFYHYGTIIHYNVLPVNPALPGRSVLAYPLALRGMREKGGGLKAIGIILDYRRYVIGTNAVIE